MMKMNNENKLNINATLTDLELLDISIDINSSVADLIQLLRDNPLAPGVIIMSEKICRGMISRNKLFEYMSRPFSIELYLKKPIEMLLEDNPFGNTIELTAETSIAEAALRSLQRPADNIFEPVVVRFFNGAFKLLDIHQLLLAQTQIHSLLVKSLREANEFKSEILSIAAHDLKNPLNSILGICSIIREDTKDIPMVNEMVNTIYRSSQHMLELVLQLLNSSVVELGKIQLNKTPLDINGILANIISNNIKLAEKKQQKIIFNSMLHEEIIISADRIRITDAVENILSNAIKYTPQGKNITVMLESVNNRVRINVIDEGPGIREEEKGKLFGKFQRLSAKPTGGESSTGLGLYIVKQIIELHNGRVWVESEFPHGSNFIIELPISPVNSDFCHRLN
jgi:signal transduction histidine kinase